jgi:bifunctional DNase/RNase
MSHDLLGNVITALGARLFAVEITHLVDNTFYANLRLLREGKEVLVSARPSDAVALALRIGAPLLVSDELMNEEGQILEVSDEDDTDSEESEANLLAELRDFLNNVRPEDFDQ